MADDIVFFLAADDETAAAARLRGPGEAFESVTCRFIEPDSAIAEWGKYFEEFRPRPRRLSSSLGGRGRSGGSRGGHRTSALP
ncbi:hypothetical protein [Streptomyces sp. NBC_01565]|uniref:hypothetical protein n=1 Tax=Streptomyces sp. NBC_01565 TaxID=2975881 RepID=UPI002253E683|nr:hypothetical protein [Streptomyces sp. NBC_01565]MCX4539144.1 hypothetical protein [Streptomyces sp. NBC_01565]